MTKTMNVVFDGKVLRPESLPHLEPNTRYVITIQDLLPAGEAGDAWDVLEALAGTADAPEDWAGEHDHYLYGLPGRSERSLNELGFQVRLPYLE